MCELVANKQFSNGIYICFEKNVDGIVNKAYFWTLWNIAYNNYRIEQRLCPRTTQVDNGKIYKECIMLPKVNAYEFELIDGKWILIKK